MATGTYTATVLVRTRAMRELDAHVAATMNSRYPRVDAAARGWVIARSIAAPRPDGSNAVGGGHPNPRSRQV